MRQAEATQSHPKPDSVALLYDVSKPKSTPILTQVSTICISLYLPS